MNIGFVSTRLAGTDGVTLETVKWARICRDLGHSTFFCAGQLDPEIRPGLLVPEAHFTHPEVVSLQQRCFGVHTRAPETTEQLHQLRRRLKALIVEFVKKYSIDHWLRDLAQSEGVDMRFVANRFSETRQFDEKGEKIYRLDNLIVSAEHTPPSEFL